MNHREPDEKGVGCFLVMIVGILFWSAVFAGIVHFFIA